MEKKLKKGSNIIVKHILGETAIPLLEDLGDCRYRLKVDALCKGEHCKGGFYHLRQAIEEKPGKEIINTVMFWPRLRAALHKAGLQPVNVPGGGNPYHYTDQIALADFKVKGSHFFIVERKDIEKYLEQLPLDEKGLKRRKEFEAAAEKE